jgi:hypothetical protein
MNSAGEWRLSRVATLLLVLALHLALVGTLLMTSQGPEDPPANPRSVELLLLPPAGIQRARVDVKPLPRARPRFGLALSPPAIDPALPDPAAAPQSTPSAAGGLSNGGRPGVDWAAEARRALQAFEIRSHQPTNGKSVAGKPGEDNWAPRTPHHAGEQFKTASGDWIVWINADCYQLATSNPSAYAIGATPPETICLSHKE